MRPNVLLFDERPSVLNAESVGEVLNVIEKLAVKHDLTMLLVTHDMRFAREISDRVSAFDPGRIGEDLSTNPNEEHSPSSSRRCLTTAPDQPKPIAPATGAD